MTDKTATALRERCSGGGNHCIEMIRQDARDDGGCVSWRYRRHSHLAALLCKTENNQWRETESFQSQGIVYFHCSFARTEPFASLSSTKGHHRAKLAKGTTFSSNTQQTVEETLETNLADRIPELETVTSSLNTHLLQVTFSLCKCFLSITATLGLRRFLLYTHLHLVLASQN